MGLGGGFIILPYLLWRFPFIKPAEAVVVSLSGVFTTNFLATWIHVRKRTISLREVYWIAPLGILGAVLASPIPGLMSRGQFEWAYFAIVLALLLRTVWAVRPSSQSKASSNSEIKKSPLSLRRTIWPMVPIVSAFAAAFGVGGGIILMPLLLSNRFGLTTAHAAALSAIIQLFGTGSALFSRFDLIRVLIGSVLSIALGVLAGVPLGIRVSHRLPRRTAKLILILVLSLIATQIFFRKTF